MKKSDFKIFLKKKIKVNAYTNHNTNLFYSGEIIKLSEDHMLFRDKYGSTILIKYEYIVNVEEIAEENFEKIFGGGRKNEDQIS
jgi:ribosome maturation factor RimP